MTKFEQKIIRIVKAIPKGKVLTYGEVAKKAGSQNASRAVGSVMAKNVDKNVPCHRVVRSDGTIGMYNGLQGKDKALLLQEEDVQFEKEGKVLFTQ